MRKTIIIDEKPVAFRATASTLKRYRELTGRDLLQDFQTIEAEMRTSAVVESTDVLMMFFNFAYVMAKQGDGRVPDEPDEWMDTFEVFPINEVMPQLVTLWKQSVLSNVELKKNPDQQSENSQLH